MQFCPGLSAPSLHLFQVPNESHKDSHSWNASGLPPGDYLKGFPWSFLLLKALELAYSRLTPCPLASLPILLRTPPGSPSLFSCRGPCLTGRGGRVSHTKDYKCIKNFIRAYMGLLSKSWFLPGIKTQFFF